MKYKVILMHLFFINLCEDFDEEGYKNLLQKSFIVNSDEASTGFFWDWIKSTGIRLSSVEKIFKLFKLQVENLLAY